MLLVLQLACSWRSINAQSGTSIGSHVVHSPPPPPPPPPQPGNPFILQGLSAEYTTIGALFKVCTPASLRMKDLGMRDRFRGTRMNGGCVCDDKLCLLEALL